MTTNPLVTRPYDQLRSVTITTNVADYAEGSALITMGNTKVWCTASLVAGPLPGHCQKNNHGWITAEYAMLPRAGQHRSPRVGTKPNGRAIEIQRLIGRSLRVAADLYKLQDRQIVIDCDVLQADGGTRCAAITGAWLALKLCEQRLLQQSTDAQAFIDHQIAAVSVGLVDDQIYLDLDYALDSRCSTDMNIVQTRQGQWVEIQASAEKTPLSSEQFNRLLALSEQGLQQLYAAQNQALLTI